jgi:DNA-binding XRE family transcriptional regulator
MAKTGPRAPKQAAPAKPDRPVESAPTPSPSKRAVKLQSEVHPERREPKASVVANQEKVRGEDLQLVFGQNLKAARISSGLKQSDVAERTGLTQQYLSLIEAGQQNVTLKTMSLLAEVVDHHVADMLRRAFG